MPACSSKNVAIGIPAHIKTEYKRIHLDVCFFSKKAENQRRLNSCINCNKIPLTQLHPKTMQIT